MASKYNGTALPSSGTGESPAAELLRTQSISRIRQVHSHPSMATSPPPGTRSLGSLMPSTAMTPFAAQYPTCMTIVPVLSGVKPGSVQSRMSPDERSPAASIQNRQASPSGPEDNEEDEDGAHDTITSLAGAKMLQRYRRAISGSRKGSATSLNQVIIPKLFHNKQPRPGPPNKYDIVMIYGMLLLQQSRLEDLFLIEEDVKDTDYDGLLEDPQIQEVKETGLVLSAAEIFVPPDGGYGWLIAFGAFNALFWTAGMIKSYGVIFDTILETFPESSVTLAAWIPASMTTLALALAPIASALCQKFNCRNVTLAGALFCSFGIALSSLAQNVETLFITFGLLTGIGVGLSTTPGIILVARYFERRRGIANAFCLSGTAAGSLCLPFLIEALVDAYDFSGTMLILGGCMLHIAISAALYRPLATHVLIMRNSRLHPTLVEVVENPEQQVILPKEPDLKSLAAHQHHHHHHHHYNYNAQVHAHHNLPDPNEVVARLQVRLNSMDDGDREDSISVNSSVSQDKHQHQHHHYSGQHTPQRTHQGMGFRNSFTSLACSLPPHLDQQFPPIHTPTNSSLTSREDLQCGWDAPTSRVDASATPLHNIDPGFEPVLKQDKLISLSDLFVHQVGYRLTQYKSMLFGSQHHTDLSHVASFVSVSNAARPDSTQHPSFGHPSVSRKSSIMHRRKSGLDSFTKKLASRVPSMIFSIEDMTTDSTCVLKDNRHPSVSSVNSSTGTVPLSVGRVVNLNRSLSSATDSHVAARSRNSFRIKNGHKRQRYMSEGHDDGLIRRDSGRFVLSSSRGPSIYTSLELGLAEAPTPIREENEYSPKEKSETKEEEEEEEEEEEVKLSCAKRVWNGINKYLDLSLVKDPFFVIMVISVMCMSVGVPHVLFFLPTYARSKNVGADPAVLLSATSIADLSGRIAFGFMLDANIVPKHLAYASMILASGFSVIGLAMANSFPTMALAMLIYGLGSGAWFLMVPLLLADFLGVERIGSSYGLIRLFQAMSNLGGPVIAGALWTETRSFSASFFVMGVIMCSGSILVLCKPLIIDSNKVTKQANPEAVETSDY
jgi:MFS family permease